MGLTAEASFFKPSISYFTYTLLGYRVSALLSFQTDPTKIDLVGRGGVTLAGLTAIVKIWPTIVVVH